MGSIEYKVEGPVARLIFDNPSARNGVTHEMADSLRAHLEVAAGGTVAFVTDAETHTTKAFLTAYAEAAGVALPSRSVPGWLLRSVAGTLAWGWTTFRIRGRPPITPFAASLLSAQVTIRSTAAESAMGWRPVIGLEAGLAQVAAAS